MKVSKDTEIAIVGAGIAGLALALGLHQRGISSRVYEVAPKIRPLERSMLKAVGVEYQDVNYRLREGDEVSLFPPVQGG